MSIFLNKQQRELFEQHFSRDDVIISETLLLFAAGLTSIGSFKGAEKNKKMYNLVKSIDKAEDAWRKIKYNADTIGLTDKQQEVVEKLFKIIINREKQKTPKFMKEYIDAFDERSRLTIVLVTLFWAIVIITSVIFFIGLIFGFIYAIKAEAKEETWSNWRVLKRSFLGFGYVAIYWNTYGYW